MFGRNKKSSFCALPWDHLYICTDGSYRPCCHAPPLVDEGKSLSIQETSISKAFNSDTLKKLRLDMLSGQRNKACHVCYQVEDSGGLSSRQMENSTSAISQRKAKRNTKKDGTFNNFPTYLHIGLGNLCNLKCVMCGPICSDKWISDYRELYPESNFKGEMYSWPNEKTVGFDELINQLPLIQKLYFTGGEPTINAHHSKLLDLIIENNLASGIQLNYHTNLAAPLSESLLKKWEKFKKIQIGCSIDGIGKVIEYVRYPVRWRVVEQNIERLNQTSFTKVLTAATTIYNVLNITELLDWASEKQFTPDNSVVNLVAYPSYMSLSILPVHAKKRIKEHYSSWLNKNPKWQYRLSHLMQAFELPEQENLMEEFFEKTSILDKKRNLYFEKQIPFTAELLRYPSTL